MPESASGTLERVEVTGLPRTCGAQVTARMSVRAARCARGLCRPSPCTRWSPGGAQAGTRTSNPGPSGLDQNPEPGCPGGGTASECALALATLSARSIPSIDEPAAAHRFSEKLERRRRRARRTRPCGSSLGVGDRARRLL